MIRRWLRKQDRSTRTACDATTVTCPSGNDRRELVRNYDSNVSFRHRAQGRSITGRAERLSCSHREAKEWSQSRHKEAHDSNEIRAFGFSGGGRAGRKRAHSCGRGSSPLQK
jgi:hypothetical protein